jgi:hypothetical protein
MASAGGIVGHAAAAVSVTGCAADADITHRYHGGGI